MSTEGAFRTFLAEQMEDDGVATISADHDLLDSGMIDSLLIVQLVSFIEERFGVSVTPDEVVPENFGTLQALVGLVEAKSAAA